MTRTAHPDEIDLSFRNPARQAEEFAIGAATSMIGVLIRWSIRRTGWCIRWPVGAGRADFPHQNLDLGRCGRIAKCRRGQAVAARVSARAGLAGGRERPSAGGPIDESGAKPPLFRSPPRRASGLRLSTTHAIALGLLGASGGRSAAGPDVLELRLHGFVAGKAQP